MSHECCSNIIIPTRVKFDSYSAICQGQDECLNNLAPLTDSALLSMLRYGWDGKVWSILPCLLRVQNLHERSGKIEQSGQSGRLKTSPILDVLSIYPKGVYSLSRGVTASNWFWSQILLGLGKTSLIFRAFGTLNDKPGQV